MRDHEDFLILSSGQMGRDESEIVKQREKERERDWFLQMSRFFILSEMNKLAAIFEVNPDKASK